MCFSAGASFGAAAVLGAAGVAALRKVTKSSQTMFAAVPLVFSVQQVCEGILWLSLSGESNPAVTEFTTYSFLFFAQILWPLWLPLSMLLIEPSKIRKRLILITTLAGAATSSMLAYRLLFFDVSSEISSCHILYTIETTEILKSISSVLYVISIIVPGFISGVPRMRLLAVILTLSLIVSKIFYEAYLLSVWCFFAAVLSIIVIYVMAGLKISAKNFSISNSIREIFPDDLRGKHL